MFQLQVFLLLYSLHEGYSTTDLLLTPGLGDVSQWLILGVGGGAGGRDLGTISFAAFWLGGCLLRHLHHCLSLFPNLES